MNDRVISIEIDECPMCGNERSRGLYPRRRYRTGDLTHFGIRFCTECKHLYLSPRPADATLGDYYSDQYYTVANSALGSEASRAHAVRYAFFVERFYSGAPGKLLDVGCGDGEFLAHAAELGWQCHGVEMDGRTRERVASRPGVLSMSASLDDVGESEFDCITLFESIEHLTDPAGALCACRDLLRPGGSVIIKTPNAMSLERRALGPDWVSLEIPRHLHFFSSNSLRRCLTIAELEVRSVFCPSGEQALTRSVWLALSGRGQAVAGGTAEFRPQSWRRTADQAITRALHPLWWTLGKLRLGHTILVHAVRPREEQSIGR